MRLDWLDEAHSVAVVGHQWGDEGKGKLVDLLASRADVVARYNGGANAGHTVIAAGHRLALHLVPCGILRPGVINVIGNGVVIDPDALFDEIDQLRRAGVEVGENLRVSDRAHIVLNHHKLEDALYETAARQAEGADAEIGTTGRGIGPCYADKALRGTAVRVADLFDDEGIDRRAVHVARVKNALLGGLASELGVAWEPIEPEMLAAALRRYGEGLAPHVADTGRLLRDARARGQRILFEGANATLLDVDHGTYPFVTSSQCAAPGIYPGSGVPGGFVDDVVGVVKAYQTRVGAGPHPTELSGATAEHLRHRGNEYGTTTGRPRRCGWLDLVSVRHGIALCGTSRLALMLLDVLSGLEELRVCTAYRIAGRTRTDMPASASQLASAEPVYHRLAGFQEAIDASSSWSDLPDAARAYVRFIEEQTGLPVALVSVGPDREQTLEVPRP